MNRYTFFIPSLLIALIAFIAIGEAEGLAPLSPKADGGAEQAVPTALQAFQSYYPLQLAETKIPQVIDAVLPEGAYIDSAMSVFDVTAQKFVYSTQRIEKRSEQKRQVTSQPMIMYAERLVDLERGQAVRIPASKDVMQQKELVITAEPPIQSSAVRLLRRGTSPLPLTVEIVAGEGSEARVLRPAAPLEGDTARFAETTAGVWTIRFTHSQELALDEIAFEDAAGNGTVPSVLFLAEPSHEYRIYAAADRVPTLNRLESVNLLSGKQPVRVSADAAVTNEAYVAADADADGVVDAVDNCVHVGNATQEDEDANYLGDACEDFDLDGVMGATDNCKDSPNKNQRDEDSDGVGDACDPDESRLMAKYPWLPWVGIVFAGLVVITLFVLTAFATRLPGLTAEDAEDNKDTLAS